MVYQTIVYSNTGHIFLTRQNIEIEKKLKKKYLGMIDLELFIFKFKISGVEVGYMTLYCSMKTFDKYYR